MTYNPKRHDKQMIIPIAAFMPFINAISDLYHDSKSGIIPAAAFMPSIEIIQQIKQEFEKTHVTQIKQTIQNALHFKSTYDSVMDHDEISNDFYDDLSDSETSIGSYTSLTEAILTIC